MKHELRAHIKAIFCHFKSLPAVDFNTGRPPFRTHYKMTVLDFAAVQETLIDLAAMVSRSRLSWDGLLWSRGRYSHIIDQFSLVFPLLF